MAPQNLTQHRRLQLIKEASETSSRAQFIQAVNQAGRIAQGDKMHHNVKALAGQFQILGEFLEAGPYGTGHINDTYRVVFVQGGTIARYILQRINHNVFKNPPALMENVMRVTSHIREKLIQQGASDISRRVLTVIPTRAGGSYFREDGGNYWRAYIFIEKARTYDVLETPKQAYEAAKAFGKFQGQLADLSGPSLHDAIPNFHNGPMRYQTFLKALEADVCQRAVTARPEIEFLRSHAPIFDVLPALYQKGKIPLRVTHNDTKLNNVMLDDKTGEGICVIDLDTLMPGLIHFDFGDIVRTSTSPAKEDEQDLSKVTMLLPRFEAIVNGFLESIGESITPTEREHLVLAGKLITLIIGTRFLTDYLAGDQYFKIHREGHNLDRSRTQFKLVASMEEQEEEMHSLVAKWGAH